MKRLVYIVFLGISVLWAAATACTASGDGALVSGDTLPATRVAEDEDEAMALLDIYDDPVDGGRWETLGEMPDSGCVRLKVNVPEGSFREVFNDTNKLHYEVAQTFGIDPIFTEADAHAIKRPLVKVKSDRYLYVDSLNFSYPYLVPESYDFLSEIGRRFHDTLAARDGGDYRLKVTSLLRTVKSVKSLRRVNRASTDSSAHLFGTTFDISFKYFPYTGGKVRRTANDMKNLLAEILYDLKSDGRCYVIYENKQGCFHITPRPNNK